MTKDKRLGAGRTESRGEVICYTSEKKGRECASRPCGLILCYLVLFVTFVVLVLVLECSHLGACRDFRVN
jgi:hypothetical protein